MLTSYVLLDFATLDRIYADEYVNINHDGTVFTKKQIIEMVRTASLRLDSIPVSNSLVKFYGAAAVMTGIRKYYRAGKMLGTVRFTEVWVNRKNRWQCVSGQLTTVQGTK